MGAWLSLGEGVVKARGVSLDWRRGYRKRGVSNAEVGGVMHKTGVVTTEGGVSNAKVGVVMNEVGVVMAACGRVCHKVGVVMHEGGVVTAGGGVVSLGPYSGARGGPARP